VTTRGQDIVSVIKQQIEQFGMAVTMVDVGTVIEIGDGIARIHGLAAAKYKVSLPSSSATTLRLRRGTRCGARVGLSKCL